MKHSSGPWRYNIRKTFGERGAYIDRIEDPHIGKLDLICENLRPNDAEFICRAVNCHYELLGALKFAKSVIQSGECWTESCEKMIDGIIAQAEGKE